MEFAMVQRKRGRDGRYDVLVFPAAITDNYFLLPCESKRLCIFLVRNLDNIQARPRILSKDDLNHKVVLLPLENGRDYLLLPICTSRRFRSGEHFAC